MKKYTGFIYRAYCLVSKKSYIGQTINTLEIRKNKHLSDTFGKKNSQLHFHKAIRKYGIDNFEWTIIDTILTDSQESLYECLDILEIKYIEQYDSYRNGYNMTPGGQGGIIKELKKVTIYDDNGEVIKYCLSCKDAASFLQVPEAVIRSNVTRNQNFLYKNWKRYILRYSDEILTEQEIGYIKQLAYKTPVYMFNQSGIMIQSFETAKKASKILNINYTTICNCCNKITVSTLIDNKVYTFRRYDNLTKEDKQSLIKPFKHKKKIRAYNYSNNKIVGTYNSILEASKTLNIPYSTLNKCVRESYDYLKVGKIKIKFKEING